MSLFPSRFLGSLFFGEPDAGHAGFVLDQLSTELRPGIRGITLNSGDTSRIREELNATHEYLDHFPLICLFMEDDEGKYILVQKNLDPTHIQYDDWGFVPGPPGATVLKVSDVDASKIAEAGYNFVRPQEGWKEKAVQLNRSANSDSNF